MLILFAPLFKLYPSAQGRLIHTPTPALDPFATPLDLFPYSHVDFPLSSIGSGQAAYSKAMGLTNTIVFYRGHFTLFNITPHTINRLPKTRKRLFYVTHYCTIIKNNQRYIVELMWPVWVGKAPRGVLTKAMPGWNNPFLEGKAQEFHIAEFAFVNLRYLWPYDHSWRRMDINRSPLESEAMKTWWKEVFLPSVKIRCEETFGYSIFRFSEGYHNMPSYVPPMAHEAEAKFEEEKDRAKVIMGKLAPRMDEAPEDYWWNAGGPGRAALPFVRKWEELGLEVVQEEPIYQPLDSRLPNGHPIYDANKENIADFFDKYQDPTTYFLRKEVPPVTGTLVEEVAANYDSEMDAKTMKEISGKPEVDRGGFYINARDARIFNVIVTKGRYKLPPGLYEDWIQSPNSQKLMDDFIHVDIMTKMKESAHLWPLISAERKETRATLLREFREHYDVIPETGPATEANQGLDDTDSEADWSSDEETGYSASWVYWGDATEFSETRPPGYEPDISDEPLETWGRLLKEERGSINDGWEFQGLVDYEPTPDPPADLELIADEDFWTGPLRWNSITAVWAPSKSREDRSTQQDPRHEE